MTTRQDGEVIVHFDPDGDGPMCRRTYAIGGVSDPRETTCGACLRLSAWKQAWKAEAKRVKAL